MSSPLAEEVADIMCQNPVADALSELLIEKEDEIVEIHLKSGYYFEINTAKCVSLIEQRMFMIIDKRTEDKMYFQSENIESIRINKNHGVTLDAFEFSKCSRSTE